MKSKFSLKWFIPLVYGLVIAAIIFTAVFLSRDTTQENDYFYLNQDIIVGEGNDDQMYAVVKLTTTTQEDFSVMFEIVVRDFYDDTITRKTNTITIEPKSSEQIFNIELNVDDDFDELHKAIAKINGKDYVIYDDSQIEGVFIFLICFGIFFVGTAIVTITFGLVMGARMRQKQLAKAQEKAFGPDKEIVDLEKQLKKAKLSKELLDINGPEKFCPYCGTKVKAGADKCKNCGASV